MTHPETTDTRPKTVALWWRAITHVARLNNEKHLGLIAAGVAFYAILAVFPGIAATIALWGIIGDPALALDQIEEFRALIPSDVYGLLAGQLTTLATTDGLTLGWASLLSFGFALWSARAGVAALMQGLNAIYDAPNRSGLSHYLRAFLLTFSLIGVVLIANGLHRGCARFPGFFATRAVGKPRGRGIEVGGWSGCFVGWVRRDLSAGSQHRRNTSAADFTRCRICRCLLDCGVDRVFCLFAEFWSLQRNLRLDRCGDCHADVVVYQRLFGLAGWCVKR